MTVKELKAKAKELGLKGYSKLNKAELIELVFAGEEVELQPKAKKLYPLNKAGVKAFKEDQAGIVEECKDQRQHIKVHSNGVVETTFTANGVFSSNLAKKISFSDLHKNKNWKTAVLVFTKDSFTKDYSLIERSYCTWSDEKYFNAMMGGSSLFGNCLDGKDNLVRLDKYMYYENWEVEYCYITEEKEEISC